MDLLQDSRLTMRTVNVRLRSFLEQVNKLQETNHQLETQINNWDVRSPSDCEDWTKQEETLMQLRTQVGKLLMENAQLALQSDNMKSRAAAIQARCETEEQNTLRLEQQVAQLREAKRRVDESSVVLRADIHSSMTELQEMQQNFKAAQAEQLQRAASCNVLLAQASAAASAAEVRGGGWEKEAGEEEEDGTGMELTQLLDRIRTQCDQNRLPSTGERHHDLRAVSSLPQAVLGPGHRGAAASASASASAAGGGGGGGGGGHRGALCEEEAAWAQVNLSGAALREARAELVEARQQWHSLQVEIETLHALEKGLENSLQQTQTMYSNQLQDLSQVIQGLESELEQVRGGLATQRQRHGQLLNTKMRLEREISTYRRLLEREEGRYMSRDGHLGPWKLSVAEQKEVSLENDFSDPAVTPDEPKSEPLPEIPSLLPMENGLKRGGLRRQQSLVILTEPETDKDLPISTVKTQEILQGNVVQESAEGHGTIETEKVDKVIKQWEGSFFRGNPKLRKKSVSLRFDLHMAAADEGCAQTKQDSLPDVEVRLIMKRSRSIPAITP